MHEVEYIGRRPREQEGQLGSAELWVVLGIIALVMVVFMQWFRGDLFGTTMKAAPASVASSEEVDGGQYSDFAMSAKALVKLRRAIGEGNPTEVANFFKEEITPLAVTRAERLRLAVVAGELVGKDEALAQIAELQKELEAGTPLAMDAAWLKILYERGPDNLGSDVQDSLMDRHGWFGQLALAFNRPITDPLRRAAVGGRQRILSTFQGLFWVHAGVFVAGLIALPLLVTNRQALFVSDQVDDVPDESLQGFVLFCGGFVILVGTSLLPFGFGIESSLGAAIASQLAIWGLVFIPAWPLLRGVKWTEFTRATGLHAGRGVLREAVLGVAAFVAWTPITIVLGLVLGFIESFLGSSSLEGTGHPMFEPPPSDSVLLVFLSVIASVVWAPLIEETVFRGFLYGWLRERASFLVAALVSSVAFGIVHPYSPLGMLQVGAAGIMFAVLREWRGSLIAPMVAHAMHNGFIVIVSLAIASAIGG